MYIITNALKNLKRNKGRNILVGVVLFAIIATTVVTLSITNTAQSMIDRQQQMFGSRVEFQLDVDAFMESLDMENQTGFPTIPHLTAAQTIALTHSPSVQSYSLQANTMGFSEDMTAVGEDEDATGSGVQIMHSAGGNLADDDDFIMPVMRLLGSSSETMMDGETRTLYQGREPENLGEAMITRDFAQHNDLSIGDTFNFTMQQMFSAEGESQLVPYELTVVGIYSDFTPEAFPGMFSMSPMLNPANEILTSLDTILEPISEEGSLSMEATYYLHDPSYLADFEAEARALGVTEYMMISTDAESFHAMVAPLEGLRSVAQTFLLIVLILGGLILMILSLMAIRERKYEVGILRAMGMKKSKVAFGLVTEMLAMTLLCLVFGMGSGMIVAQPLSDNLLSRQVETVANDENPQGNQMGGARIISGGGSGLSLFGVGDEEVEVIDALTLNFNVRTLAEIIGIALMLTTVASLASISRINKYEPIKILMERD